MQRIEALAGRIADAQSLCREASGEAKSFMQALLREIFEKSTNWKTYKLDDVAPINMGQSPPGNSYKYRWRRFSSIKQLQLNLVNTIQNHANGQQALQNSVKLEIY